MAASARLRIQDVRPEVLELGGVRLIPEASEDLLLSSPGVKDAAAFSVPGQDGVHPARAAVVVDTSFEAEDAEARLARAFPADRRPTSARSNDPTF